MSIFTKIKDLVTGELSAEDLNRVGMLYLKGSEFTRKDPSKAFFCFQMAAEKGLSVAQYNLGFCYFTGQGTKENNTEAVKWFRKAAEHGDADAQYKMGLCYSKGFGVDEDESIAVEWYRKAAEQGQDDAQHALGVRYYNGDGVDEDEKEAAKWFRRSANQGNADAQNDLGECYRDGDGVEKSVEMAEYWLNKAAEQGHERAKKNLKEIMKETSVSSKGNASKEVSTTSRKQTVKEESPKPSEPKDKNETHNILVKTADEELDSLIGLAPVKKEISQLRDFIHYQMECRKRGLPTSSVSNHCVFTGNPGTGKTTVARIVARIYHEMGVMKTDKVIETDRSGLVAEYIGHTAQKTNNVIDSALDGILFIDEAYTLAGGGEKDFGREAIDTLLKRMEDNRDRLIVIVAGYTDEMKKFIDANPGLQSRFTRYIEFPDYSAEELVQIFLHMAEKEKYICSKKVQAELLKLMRHSVSNKDNTFGNARYVRNCYEEMKRRLATRVAGRLSELSNEQLRELTVEDLG